MNLQEIKKQLPSGAVKAIAERAKVSTSLVSLTFNGKTNSVKKTDIMNATAEYLNEYKAKEREASNALKEAIAG